MKRLLAILLLIGSILSLAGCGSNVRISYDDAPDDYNEGNVECMHDWAPATFDSPSKCLRCGETIGQKLTSATEWGFYNLYEIGNCLISVEAYDLSAGVNSYVIADGRSMHFENGHIFGRRFSVEAGKAKFGTSGDAYPYSVANNDAVSVSNGYKTYRISERKTKPGRDNFVCFVIPEGSAGFRYDSWYVPYSLIDWERGAENYTDSDGDTGIKLYLIS